METNKKNGFRFKLPSFSVIICFFCIAMLISAALSIKETKDAQNNVYVTYTEFMDMAKNGTIKTVVVNDEQAIGTGDDEKQYTTNRIEDDTFVTKLINAGVDVNKDNSLAKSNQKLYILLNLLFPIIIFIYFFKMMKSGPLAKKGISEFDKTKLQIKFSDVAGQEEAKESLREIVDFLHDKDKYVEMGAKLPKGALLVGPPGTGKTLLAKAVAGEANVPFYSISGSDFVEMFVGVGASRVRQLFATARKNSPCIVFIDEIDAIAGKREAIGSSEREQTLNQLLTEMDGFNTDNGVIVLAATNRPEILDKAILRPGRFDRRIIVNLPDLNGREGILGVHIQNLKLSDDVDLKEIAEQTAGVSGADIANIANEAAILAVKKGENAISQQDFIESIENVLVGKEKTGGALSEKEKHTVAIHEVGHAVVSIALKKKCQIKKISIIPRVQGALGYVMQNPSEDIHLKTQEDFMTDISILLAGRAAEDIYNSMDIYDCGITNGASDDLQKATNLAKQMIGLYGFGTIKENPCLLVFGRQSAKYLDGSIEYTASEKLLEDFDNQCNYILNKAYDVAKQNIFDNLEEHKTLMNELLKNESITIVNQDVVTAIINKNKKNSN